MFSVVYVVLLVVLLAVIKLMQNVAGQLAYKEELRNLTQWSWLSRNRTIASALPFFQPLTPADLRSDGQIFTI